MNIAKDALRGLLRPVYRDKDGIKRWDIFRQTAGGTLPGLIRPDPRSLYIALTANCNLRCKGCLYGRDFMPGHQLEWPVVRDLLDDAKALGFERVRLYGGEPLMHKDLQKIVRHTADLGLEMWLTTNAIMLEKKFDTLYEAGLRNVSFGFYGNGNNYNEYVQRGRAFERMEAGIAYVRERYGDSVDMHMDWLLMRPTCSLESLDATWSFAERYQTPIFVNLVHYSLPYFTKGEDRELQFRPDDRDRVVQVVDRLLEYKQRNPALVLNSVTGLHSIPDWLMKGPDMRVPCTEYRLIWVGADGTVQMCYVTFKLGNLHDARLRDMLFTDAHAQAARDAYALNCPNCHCGYDKRTLSHLPSRRKYA